MRRPLRPRASVLSQEDPPPSKSARKREAQQLQALGQQLAELSEAALAQLPLAEPLPAELLTALADYRRFPSHGARRRQLRRIGKLMRDLDAEPIAAALAARDGQDLAAKREARALEDWRRRLLEDPQALAAFFDEHPQADRQALRHQLNRVASAPDDSRRRQEERALFRLLRKLRAAAEDAAPPQRS